MAGVQKCKKEKREKQKRLIGILVAAAAGMVLLGTALAVWLGRSLSQKNVTRDGSEEESVDHTGAGRGLTLQDIAYDGSEEKPLVYIRENGEFVPYLVLTADYGGNVLLLREDLLPEAMQYEPSPHGEAAGAPGALWAFGELGAYYEKSSVDEFLNSDFLDVFNPEVRAAIKTTSVEVTDMDCYEEWNYATHVIQRKVFLLSSVELGVSDVDGSMTAREGDPLEYFKNKEYVVKTAHMADGEAWPYWTRTPWLAATCLVTVIGTEALFDLPADFCIGVRPAFCMERDTAIRESGDVVAGVTAYVLEIDGE